MNIVIDARESGTSTGRYIDKLIEYLAKIKTDHSFTIITKPKRISYLKTIAPGFKIVPADIKEFTFAEQLKFKGLLKSLNPDLVHFGMIQQPILYKGKVITSIQDLTGLRFNNPSKNIVVYKFKQFVYRIVILIAIKKSEAIISPSKFVKEDLIKFSSSKIDKFFVTYYSADKIKDQSEPIKNLLNQDFIMYVGRPTPHKNIEGLIKAFSLLKDNNPKLKLVLAGKKDSNYSRIENLVSRLGLKDIYFTDFVSDGQLRWLYEKTRAYVFPSFSEGFGLPSLEAMAHGAPVVSSSATCLPEINGQGAIYFDPEDVKEMAEKINSVINNEGLRQELIHKGYIQLKKYSWEKTAQETLDIYNSVLKS